MTPAGDSVVFAVCLTTLVGIVANTAFEMGREVERERCRPTTAPKKMSYDMPRRQLMRLIRWEQSKGEN